MATPRKAYALCLFRLVLFVSCRLSWLLQLKQMPLTDAFMQKKDVHNSRDVETVLSSNLPDELPEKAYTSSQLVDVELISERNLRKRRELTKVQQKESNSERGREFERNMSEEELTQESSRNALKRVLAAKDKVKDMDDTEPDLVEGKGKDKSRGDEKTANEGKENETAMDANRTNSKKKKTLQQGSHDYKKPDLDIEDQAIEIETYVVPDKQDIVTEPTLESWIVEPMLSPTIAAGDDTPSRLPDPTTSTAASPNQNSTRINVLPSTSPIPFPSLVVATTVETDVSIPLSGTVYEAEKHQFGGGAKFSKQNNGYKGTGYVDFGSTGSFVQWTVSVPQTQRYRLFIRYAVGMGDNRACRLYVRGRVAIGNVPFRNTGSWRSWRELQLTGTLYQGSFPIKVESLDSGPNIDSLRLVPLGGQPPSPGPPPSSGPPPCPRPRPSPSPSTTSSPASNFMLKMFWEDGMRWQHSSREKKWCADIDSDDDDDKMEIKECNDDDRKQRWMYSSGRLRPRDDDDVCWTHYDRTIRLRECDGSTSQRWVGFRSNGKFQLKPVDKQHMCVTQHHHPKSGERLKLYECYDACRNDPDVYDDTSHWVTGEWDGH